MSTILIIIRAKKWWHSIVSFLLGLSYLFILNFDIPFSTAYRYLPFIFILIILTAITGYFINNVTDVNEDIKAGKKVYLPDSKLKWLIVILLIQIVSMYVVYSTQNGLIALFLYLLQSLCFILYSVKPFRLKKNIFLSVILDSLYNSTVFAFFIFYFFVGANKIDLTFCILMFLWLFIRGIKNYIFHLIEDKKNDLKSGHVTLVHYFGIRRIQKIQYALFIIEIILFAFFAYISAIEVLYVLLIFIALYSMPNILFPLYKKQYKRILHLQRYLINDFYENILPLTILILLSLKDIRFLIILPIHLLLFPNVFIRLLELVVFCSNQTKSVIAKLRLLIKN